MSSLTKKQQIFIDEYLKSWNATDAARRAGYSGNDNALSQRGFELVRNRKINDVISTRLKESAMSADEVLKRLAAHARGSVGDFFVRDEQGQYHIDFDAPNADLSLIKKFKHTVKTYTDRDGNTEITHHYDFELHDPQSALQLLGKYHKLFVDRIEHSLPDWQQKLKEIWDKGNITHDDVIEHLGEDLARDFFNSVGIDYAGIGSIK